MPNFSDLPPRARERATALQNTADAYHAAVHGLMQQLRGVNDERDQIAQRIRRAMDPRFYGGAVAGADDLHIRSMQARVDVLTAEVARVTAAIEAQSVNGDAGTLVRRVEEYLRAVRPEHVIADRPVAPPPLKKGEDVRTAIEARRRRVREIQAEQANVETAPIPSAEAKRLAREQIAALAERGKPDVSPLLAAGDPFRFAHMVSLVKVPPTGAGSVETIDVAATLAWFHPDALVVAIEREIDQQADDAIALTGQQRAARLEQIANELIATEREEVALLDLAAEQGLAIQHRGDIDVRALLGVEIALAAAAA